MTPTDFRRLALALPHAIESSHMNCPDFRVGGHVFATLAAEAHGYGNLMLTLEQQAAFVADSPDLFLPVAGGWGRMGITHICLAHTSEDVLAGALHTAYQLRVQKNQKSRKPRRANPA